jgi:hypothetical protein
VVSTNAPRLRFASVAEKSVALAQLRFRKASSEPTLVGPAESINDTLKVDADVTAQSSQAKSPFSLCPAR